MWTQCRAGKGEYRGVGACRFTTHEERLVAKKIGNRVDRPRSKREDFLWRMSSNTLAVERCPHLAANHHGHERPDRARHPVKEAGRAFAEVLVIHPAVAHAD